MTEVNSPDDAPRMRRSVSQLTPTFTEQARTPAGLQSRRALFQRRWLMLALNLGALAALAAGVATILGEDGWSAVDIGLFATVMLSAPWTILGFWNALIGLLLLRVVKNPLASVAPFWTDLDAEDPIRQRIAVAMAMRNEDFAVVFARLRQLRRELDVCGIGDQVDIHVLSDSSDPQISAAERAQFDIWREHLAGDGAAFYRRRAANIGFKAGNIREFVDRYVDQYGYFLPLDADSVMSGAAVARLAQVMQRHPRLGILQSLAVGAPARNLFSRFFQFGMRHGMRSFTMGSAWWQGDCGPFWGHNALIRMRAFHDHCRLPVLPGAPPLGGPILSHDQIEAVMMRRGGFEVRVAPVEGESWEENPVTLLDFIKRERRWCNGNIQYWRLLGMRDLLIVSRFQLLQAIMMYLAPPAWMLMTALAAMKALELENGFHNAGLAIGLFATMFMMSLAPKLFGVIDIALERGGMKRYGGARRFTLSALAEIPFGMLMAPAVALDLTIFLFGLLFGRKLGWGGQQRDAYRLAWREAAREFWPQFLFGAFVTTLLAIGAPGVLPWAAPVLAGLLLAIPFAVLTATPAAGEFARRVGLAQIPEETTSPSTFRELAHAENAPAPMIERSLKSAP